MNLGQLRTAIQARGYASDTATAQTELINAAYREIVGERRWWWREAQDSSLTLTAGTPTLSLATVTDLLDIDAVRLQVGSGATAEPYDLEYMPPQQIRSRVHLDRSNGVPECWSYVNGTLIFWPYPDRAYTAVIDYLKDPPDLTVDSDTPLIPATYHDALVWQPVAELAFRERDGQSYTLATAKYERLMDKMRKAQQSVRQRQSSRYVTRSGVHDPITIERWA